MPGRPPLALTAPAASSPSFQTTLAEAGALSLRRPPKSNSRETTAIIDKLCKSDVSEEWQQVDDQKIAKLRGVLKAMQEESQETQLLKRRSEDAEAYRDLEETRQSFEARTNECKAKEESFNVQQAELRRNIERSQQGLKEIKSKIEKSEQKSKEEQRECRELDKQIAELRRKYQEQLDLREAEVKKIESTKKYKDFLEDVVRQCEPDFEGDVEILMNRYRTLKAGNTELHAANHILEQQLDQVRERSTRVQTKLQTENLMISSQLHECQVNLDKHRAEAQELETRFNRALEEKELKESQVAVVQMAIEQIFLRTVKSCRLKTRQRAMHERVDVKFAPVRGNGGDAQLEAKLGQILERMEDLESIIEKAKEIRGPQEDPESRARLLFDDGDWADRVRIVKHGQPGGGSSGGGSEAQGAGELGGVSLSGQRSSGHVAAHAD